MNTLERRNKIKQILYDNNTPISGNLLAKQLNVSRQIIVGDIALLRSEGNEILATPHGYLTTLKENSNYLTKTIACNHKKNEISKEIYTIIDNGGAILDVTVEHPLYGQICGSMHIFSRYDADEFIKKSQLHSSPLLSNLTQGIHLHTISCSNEVILNRVLSALDEKGILMK
ncbi:3H domain-containing protein [Clostridium sp. DL-VIII]|uniref:transcription repressor NadR n=1 Tax=Clostridium sp. DL-VIII TaxID=641107 RepID=UPI00023AF2CC|nr:transcription repressor NadR [Clostridium sp. DL-VIII]EHI97709.1 3H domain-containing protein [Clostridium sp. DL-VIII]